MKYFKKFLIVGLFALFGVSFCSAGIIGSIGRVYYTLNANDWTLLDGTDSNCIYILDNATYYSFDGVTNEGSFSRYNIVCYTGDLYVKGSSQHVALYSGFEDIFPSGQGSCPSCPSQYTSLECQTEYSLIPISEVTKNYCEVNFDLIESSDCPISEGTGSVNRSALYVNNIQYQGADNIYIDINDILTYSMTYSSGNAVIEVEGYDVDEDYIEDIIKVQEFHPDNDDFKLAFIGGLTLILPYVVVVLFVIFIRKLIRKIFKS